MKITPSIAHLVLGGTLAICLYYISDGKFSKTHAFILFLNNYLGPDVGWVFGIGHYTHSLLFWPFFAFILAYIYHYFTRFTIKIDGIKNIEIIDLERYKLHYLSTYFLVLAAGIMHIYLDGVMNKGGKFSIISEIPSIYEGLYWTYEDFISFGTEGLLQIHFLASMFIGVSLIFGFIFVFVWFLKNNSKKSALIVFTYIVGFLVFFWVVGSKSTMDHPDGGGIIYVSIFWVVPLILCVLSTKKFKFMINNNKKIKITENPNKKLLLIIIWLFLIGIFSMFFSIYGFIFNETIVANIYSKYGDDISLYFSYEEFFILVLTIEIIHFISSILNFICVAGLLLKKTNAWKFAIYYHLILSWTIIGLVIACALNETSIKEIFKK